MFTRHNNDKIIKADIFYAVSLNGDWDFAYPPGMGGHNRSLVSVTRQFAADGLALQQKQPSGIDSPVIPEGQEFVAKMPVPGYWDDNLARLESTSLWGNTRFNPEYRHIIFPMNDNPPDASLPYLVGVGWYRKTLNIPLDWASKMVTLHIGGVVLEAWVWLNGNLVGYHLGHSTPFEMTLEKWLKPGSRNDLVIAVANTRRDRSGCALRGYRGFSAGIYRPVFLKIANKVRIISFYLSSVEANQKLRWVVELDGEVKKSVLDWRIIDPEGDKIMGRGTTRDSEFRSLGVSEFGVRQLSNSPTPELFCGAWETETLGMQLWSDHSPKLYQIQLSVKQNNVILDTLTQSFGLRRLERDGTHLCLNGRLILLRGVTDHHYFPLTCTPPADVDSYRANIRQLKVIGFNWIRFHTWVPPEEYMQAADELGMMIQVEMPVGSGEQEWIDILRTCRKHPSVVIYCRGNEEVLDEPNIENLRLLANLCRKFAPDALFNPQEALPGIEYYFENRKDELGKDAIEEPYPHNPRRLELLKQFADVFAPYTWGLLSYESVKADPRLIDERLATYERPCLAHELGIHGNYLNLDLDNRYLGTRIGTELFASLRKYMKEQGLLSKAPLYYQNSCTWMRILRKHAIESARKCKYVAGYDFLGGTDHNYHRSGFPSGIMNEFYELKPGESVSDVLKYNGESVLLLDCSNRRNFFTGDHFQVDILASLYGDFLNKGGLSWLLMDDAGHIHCRGRIPLGEVRNGAVEKLGTIEFSLPDLPNPSKLTLLARLSGVQYEVVNDWNFWVFPRTNSPVIDVVADRVVRSQLRILYPNLRSLGEQAQLEILSALNQDALQFLNGGGRVLLLGNETFPTLPTSFQLSITGRAHGNLATVIYDHPLMRDFPHEGFCDWQFYSLLEGGSAVVFNELNIPFNPIIEVVSSFKQIQKQANLFELKVGDGSLLVCSMNLDLSDPATVYLLDRLILFVGSNRFCARTVVQPETLNRLMRRGK